MLWYTILGYACYAVCLFVCLFLRIQAYTVLETYLVDWVVSVEVWPETLSITGVIPSTVALFSAIIHNGNTLYVCMYVRRCRAKHKS